MPLDWGHFDEWARVNAHVLLTEGMSPDELTIRLYDILVRLLTQQGCTSPRTTAASLLGHSLCWFTRRGV